MDNDFNINQAPGAVAAGSSGMSSAPGRLDWPLVRLLARYSAQAYVDHTVCDPFTDAQALSMELGDENCLVISFKGSKEIKDFVQDAKFDFRYLMWRGRGVVNDFIFPRVHGGFLEDFQAIESDVASHARSYLQRHPNGQIYLTGHSLGGALAILCGLSFFLQSIPVSGIYTFGQPRVGDALFAKEYSKRLGDRTFRVINANDIVPRLPDLLMGYRHAGQEIYLPPGDGPAMVNPPWLAQLMIDGRGLWDAFVKLDEVLISEHFIPNYITRINDQFKPSLPAHAMSSIYHEP